MDTSIFLFLLQDGILIGAIYALLAVAFVLVFTVTRIVFVPQGDFVAFTGLTLAALERGQVPGSVWLLLVSAIAAGGVELVRERRRMTLPKLGRIVVTDLLLPAALVALVIFVAPRQIGSTARILLSIAIIVPIGLYIYRICFRPLADASVLVLLIAAVGVHWLMIGLGLVFFGAEGIRTTSLIDASFTWGPIIVSGQSILMLGMVLIVLLSLYLFSEKTIVGKALQAAAIDERGARLVGISPFASGQLAVVLATLIGAVSGILIAPTTTLYFDSGFLIALKGFVAAIVGGFASYPLAVVSALFVGLSEAFASFFASGIKEVIVFGLIIPVLVVRSLSVSHAERD